MNEKELAIKPHDYSYRVTENIWAGEYPVWDRNKHVQQRQLKTLTDFGISHFIDLTESGEMPEYTSLLPSGVLRETLPIPNCGVPKTADEVTGLFRRVACILEDLPESKLYIHCHGGVGRTGTIVACWYIFFEHLTAAEAIAKMRRHYAHHARSKWMNAPETEAQLMFIHLFARECLPGE